MRAEPTMYGLNYWFIGWVCMSLVGRQYIDRLQSMRGWWVAQYRWWFSQTMLTMWWGWTSNIPLRCFERVSLGRLLIVDRSMLKYDQIWSLRGFLAQRSKGPPKHTKTSNKTAGRRTGANTKECQTWKVPTCHNWSREQVCGINYSYSRWLTKDAQNPGSIYYSATEYPPL